MRARIASRRSGRARTQSTFERVGIEQRGALAAVPGDPVRVELLPTVSTVLACRCPFNRSVWWLHHACDRTHCPAPCIPDTVRRFRTNLDTSLARPGVLGANVAPSPTLVSDTATAKRNSSGEPAWLRHGRDWASERRERVTRGPTVFFGLGDEAALPSASASSGHRSTPCRPA